MSSNETKYFLNNIKSGRSVTMPHSDKPTEFTLEQVKRRFGLPVTAKATFDERLKNSGFILVRVDGDNEDDISIIINSNIDYTDDDIILCAAEYHYDKKVLKKTISYSNYRGNYKIPSEEKSKLRKIVLNVLKITGKVIK